METLSFTIPPVITRGVTHNNIKTDLPGGKKQVRNKGPEILYWKINFNRQWEEAKQFFAFYNARLGSFEPFIFVDPDNGINYAVNFGEDDLSMEEMYQVAATYGITLVQNLNEAVV
jgi:hypothetical protein